ncbi:MAG: BTAD domain-containing putative transcriptional regulator, partial [Pseudonocardiales bacterium]
MWFGVLGSLEVRDDEGRRLRVGGPLRRVLLAALLCRAPRTVPPNLLIEDLWGALPPRSAAKTLQSHLVRLRDDLGREAGSVIMTDEAGYRVDLPSAGLDVASFESALGDGLAAARRDDGRAAVVALDAALACWRDEAYLDFGDAPFAVIERMRLAELRALAMETRTDMALRLGEAATLISELEGRVTREPYRERSWEQLIIALYRSGRQADALTTYRLAHDRLAADLGVDPGPALRALEEQVLRQDPVLLAPDVRECVPLIESISSDVCPYRGLDGYGPHDASVFVGRERLSAQLVGRLAEPGVVVVTGATGSGKSSLARAGLVPSLRAGALPSSSGWRVRVATPADCMAGDLDLDVLVLDQAEEMFILLAAADHAHLAARLESFVDAGGRLVLVLRGDFFARLAELPWLSEYAQRSPLLVGPMREDELTRAVTEPARRCGIQVDADVVDAVLADATGQAQALPLISLALVRAWEHRARNAITLKSYESGGGVAEAIEATAEAVYHAMNADVRLAARRLLVRLATREGSSWVRRPLPRLAGDVSSSAVDALVTGRLLTVTLNRLELSHDALLERWPRLRAWLDERVAAAGLLEHLTAASGAWVAAGRPDSDLYRGLRLQAALDWRHGHPDDLSVDESAFLDTSSAAAEYELHKAQARAVAERRGRRRLRWVVAALAAALVAAVIGALMAVGARSAANRSARNARQAALSADARRLAALSLSAPDSATSSLL